MRWWGWGDPGHPEALPEHAVELLRATLGIDGSRQAPCAMANVKLPDATLAPGVSERLAAIVGAQSIRDDHAARVLHAAGKGYPDLVRQRRGRPEGAPDAVVYPSSHGQVRELLALCARERIAVVPWGGGTSVVGGVAPLRGALRSLLALDLRGLGSLLEVDETSLTAVVGGGMRGPAVEAALAARGLTLGHYPQSFEFVSVGGCVATRSAGQASAGYGRIDELVLGLRCATPAGDLHLPALPASAAGPDLRQLIVGSEGTLGVLTEVSLRVRPRPSVRRFEGMFFRSFAEGSEAMRVLAQRHGLPDVARLSDESETQLTLALAGPRGIRAAAGRTYLRTRGYEPGCLAILGWEGDSETVARRRSAGIAALREHGGLSLGRRPGRSWVAGRFEGPYLRDDLLGRGVMVETLETAAQWSRLPALYSAVAGALRGALDARGTPPLVMCHISHVYESGASLYFTFLARQQPGSELEQWWAAKSAASYAIVAGGGTITHHHAVGRDHLPWLAAETGELGMAALRALKHELDPAGVMNPGKLVESIPSGARGARGQGVEAPRLTAREREAPTQDDVPRP